MHRLLWGQAGMVHLLDGSLWLGLSGKVGQDWSSGSSRSADPAPTGSGQPWFTQQFGDEGYVPLRNELPDSWSLGFAPREPPADQRLVLDSLGACPG